jgi:flagellar M-ring protein FliF
LKQMEEAVKIRVEEAVTILVPKEKGKDDPYPQTRVSFFDDFPAALPTPPSMATVAGQWAGDYWQSIAVFVLAFVALLMMRSMVGNVVPAPSAPSAINIEQPPTAGGKEKEGSPTAEEQTETMLKQRRRLNSSGPNLRDELRDLVREDPDAAANVLKVWIGDAA